MLPEIEIEGQEKINSAHVGIIGLGGLGSPVALYLAASGVGKMTLVDHDVVEISNLQRQIAHVESNLGLLKVESAKQSIASLNSSTEVFALGKRATTENLVSIAKSVDILVDGTDNFETRFMVNEASLVTRTPLVSGAAIRLEGQVAVFDPQLTESPCYRCLYRDGSSVSLNCSENGVAAPLVGIIGTVQAMETIKLICDFADSSVGWIQYLDAKRMEWRKLKLLKNPTCPSCSESSHIQKQKPCTQ